MLKVHVHPGARREAVRGWRDDGALRVEVTAPPEGGRANAAVSALLAQALALPRREVSVVRGLASRAKVVEVKGLGEDEVRRRIDKALEDGDGE
jgi:uncharacterized protein (TIGR00251 family)